jgi:hypothetical protein
VPLKPPVGGGVGDGVGVVVLVGLGVGLVVGVGLGVGFGLGRLGKNAVDCKMDVSLRLDVPGSLQPVRATTTKSSKRTIEYLGNGSPSFSRLIRSQGAKGVMGMKENLVLTLQRKRL